MYQSCIFWINIPFVAIALVTIPAFMRLKGTPSSVSQKLLRVDWVGMVIFTGSITSFLIPIT